MVRCVEQLETIAHPRELEERPPGDEDDPHSRAPRLRQGVSRPQPAGIVRQRAIEVAHERLQGVHPLADLINVSRLRGAFRRRVSLELGAQLVLDGVHARRVAGRRDDGLALRPRMNGPS
jgi:hypothetical protein